MNRQQRRVSKAMGVKLKLDPVVAVHEAGHAVARVLSAKDFDLPVEQMITCIEVGTHKNAGSSYIDPSKTLFTQATTFGPTFSSDLQMVFGEYLRSHKGSELAHDNIVGVIKAAVDRGLDVTRWIRARLLITTLGPVAEAWFTKRSVTDVWESMQCKVTREEQSRSLSGLA
jgi:hypothetical protein